MKPTKKITIGNETVEADVSLYHFHEAMKFKGENCTPTSINQLLNDFIKFLDMWSDYKEMINQKSKESDFEKKLERHILCMTIKPKTEYAHQQEKEKGKNILYPVYYFTKDTVHSMAMGGNYPIKDCNFYVKSSIGNYLKIK